MGIKVLRIYIENSVIGGYFDDEFREYTHKLFEEFKKGIFKPVISSHVIAELENGAPSHVKEILTTINYEEYAINDEMLKLAEKYIEQKVVSENYYSDALHIAVATVITAILHLSQIPKIRYGNRITQGAFGSI